MEHVNAVLDEFMVEEDDDIKEENSTEEAAN
jgi:hypothetical protein